MELTTKIARVRIGKVPPDVWQSGDGILMPSIKLVLGEDARASTCEFSVLDPGLRIGAKYRAISIQQGGILVAEELLGKPKQADTGGGGAVPAAASGSTPQGGGVSAQDLTPQVKAFLDVIASHEVPKPYSEEAYRVMSLTRELFTGFADHPRRKHRSGRLVSDAAGRYQFLSSSWDDYKVKAGVKDFSPRSQDLAAVAYLKTLSAYTAINNNDLEGAIRKSARTWASLPGSPYGQPTQTMAEARKTYEERLAYYKGQPGAPMTSSPTPAAPTMEATPPAQTPVATEPAPTETTEKGTEIIIEMGFSTVDFSGLINFHFIHTKTISTKELGKEITTFSGQSVRWLLTRLKVNTCFQDVSLKDVASQLTSQLGLNLEMEGSGLQYAQLAIDGKTPFEILEAEAQRIGYKIGDDPRSPNLKIQPFARPEFTGFVIEPENLVSIRFTDQARSQAAVIPGVSQSLGTSAEAQAKTDINRATGETTQTKPDTKAGAATKEGVTGEAVKPAGGLEKDSPAAGTTPPPAKKEPEPTTPAPAVPA
jgi:muramidase (phage lysozyme)